MISLEQITGEISALEGETPTHAVMQKLAALYIVRDHMIIQTPASTPDVIVAVSDSEFMKKINGMQVDHVMTILDELMTTLSVVNPNLYDAVFRML